MPTITLPAGQINVKGPQAPTGVDRWISQECSLALTGLALTLAIAISVPAGALTFTGQANVNPLAQPAGAVVWQGLTPSLTISNNSVTVTPGVGSVTFTGLAPTVRVGDLTVFLPAGQIVIKGPARPQVVSQLGVGGYRFTGYAPAPAEAGTSGIAIPLGRLVLTGQPPDRIADKPIPMAVGALTLTGQYVGIQFSSPGVGSVVFQGYVPSLAAQTVSITIPDPGRLVWGQTALVPTLQYHFVQAIPAGSLAITGHQINVGTPETLVLQAGSLALAGQTPTIDWSTGLPVGSVPITGRVLTAVVATGAPELPVGSEVWQGYALVPIHSNGTVIASGVIITRTVSQSGTISRTVSSEVQR